MHLQSSQLHVQVCSLILVTVEMVTSWKQSSTEGQFLFLPCLGKSVVKHLSTQLTENTHGAQFAPQASVDLRHSGGSQSSGESWAAVDLKYCNILNSKSGKSQGQ